MADLKVAARCCRCWMSKQENSGCRSRRQSKKCPSTVHTAEPWPWRSCLPTERFLAHSVQSAPLAKHLAGDHVLGRAQSLVGVRWSYVRRCCRMWLATCPSRLFVFHNGSPVLVSRLLVATGVTMASNIANSLGQIRTTNATDGDCKNESSHLRLIRGRASTKAPMRVLKPGLY